MFGYGSNVINGQLVTEPPKMPFAPLTFGQAYTGPRFDSVGAVYNVPPVMAPNGVGTTEAGNITGLQPTPTAGAMGKSGRINHFSFSKSPLPMALLFLVAGLLMMHYIHYGK
jgi:hypothetical protein